jgi:hypothetical protein
VATSVSPQTILRSIEPLFFVDYATFGGALRNYTARTLEESFKRAPGNAHRRFFLLGVLKEEYSAYEDVGAFLLAFLGWAGSGTLPLESLLGYGPGDAFIEKVLTPRGIATGDDLYKAMGLQRLTPAAWGTVFPKIDLDKCLHRACDFFVKDCRNNQRLYGVDASNKIKHAGMVVPDASKYIPSLPPAPAAIFQNPDKASRLQHPFVLYAVPMSDAKIEPRLRSIEFVQNNLRLLSALYVHAQYPGELKTLGFDPPHTLFRLAQFAEVVDFLRQVTKK